MTRFKTPNKAQASKSPNGNSMGDIAPVRSFMPSRTTRRSPSTYRPYLPPIHSPSPSQKAVEKAENEERVLKSKIERIWGFSDSAMITELYLSADKNLTAYEQLVKKAEIDDAFFWQELNSNRLCSVMKIEVQSVDVITVEEMLLVNSRYLLAIWWIKNQKMMGRPTDRLFADNLMIGCSIEVFDINSIPNSEFQIITKFRVFN